MTKITLGCQSNRQRSIKLLGAVVGMLFVFFIMRSKEHRAARSSRSGSVTAAVDQTKEGAII